MKELKDLDKFHGVVLSACCKANNYSLGSHVPIEAIVKLVEKNQQQYVKLVVKTLVSNDFIRKKPTSRKNTYGLSRYGLKSGIILKKEFENNI